MKKLVFSFFGCLLTLSCFGNDFHELNDKFYVSAESVYVAPDAIYINLDGNFIPVNRIAIDENGIYAEGLMTARIIFCARCGNTWNPDLDSPVCPHKAKK